MLPSRSNSCATACCCHAGLFPQLSQKICPASAVLALLCALHLQQTAACGSTALLTGLVIEAVVSCNLREIQSSLVTGQLWCLARCIPNAACVKQRAIVVRDISRCCMCVDSCLIVGHCDPVSLPAPLILVNMTVFIRKALSSSANTTMRRCPVGRFHNSGKGWPSHGCRIGCAAHDLRAQECCLEKGVATPTSATQRQLSHRKPPLQAGANNHMASLLHVHKWRLSMDK